MSQLRSAMIRLANENPDLREHLLPLLTDKQASNTKVLINNAKVRVIMTDHPGNSLLVQELPGKPVKRKLRKFSIGTMDLVRHVSDFFLIENIVDFGQFDPRMDYDDVIAAIRRGLVIAAKKAGMDEIDQQEWRIPNQVGYEDTVSFLEVEPSDYKPIDFSGVDFSGTVKWGSFHYTLNGDYDPYAEHSDFYKEKSAGAARKLFKALKAVPDLTARMTNRDFVKFLNDSKIGYEYVPSVWR